MNNLRGMRLLAKNLATLKRCFSQTNRQVLHIRVEQKKRFVNFNSPEKLE